MPPVPPEFVLPENRRDPRSYEPGAQIGACAAPGRRLALEDDPCAREVVIAELMEIQQHAVNQPYERQ